MFIPKKLDLTGKVAAIKLVSGEEVLAHCVDNSISNIRIKQPLTLVLGSTSSAGPAQVAFTPWMLSISHDQIITIDQNNILFITEAGIDATKQYNEAVKNKTNVE